MKSFFRLHKNLVLEISFLACAALALSTKNVNFLYLIFSMSIHELGHIFAARLCGVKSENFSVHGFGIEITFPGRSFGSSTLMMISSGGPILSLMTAFVANRLGVPLLRELNLGIAILNLFPVLPLDGGHIFFCLLTQFISRKKAQNILKISGYLFGLFLSLIGICILYLSGINFSLLYIGLFILFSAKQPSSLVTEIAFSRNEKFEKSTLFNIDGEMSIIEAADSLPINSVGAVWDKKGEIHGFVTAKNLYCLMTENALPPNTSLLGKDVPKTK